MPTKTLGHAHQSITDEYCVAKPAMATDVSNVLDEALAPSDTHHAATHLSPFHGESHGQTPDQADQLKARPPLP
ncbi:hypothetical protein [Nocardioides terrae]|uniref:hypothetical protein n=1 Tax=Nocardioides terrae TaxID=574651 RepID=UPI001113FC0B|nr:hypothetical protein [Nocardioides terrae]